MDSQSAVYQIDGNVLTIYADVESTKILINSLTQNDLIMGEDELHFKRVPDKELDDLLK